MSNLPWFGRADFYIGCVWWIGTLCLGAAWTLNRGLRKLLRAWRRSRDVKDWERFESAAKFNLAREAERDKGGAP